jgi:formamidopyrimidine-DNA glycosylase
VPELPEVQTVLNGLEAEPIWRTRIERVAILWPRVVLPLAPETFVEKLEGCEFSSLGRRGKQLLLGLSRAHSAAGWISCHLRMTGKFFVCPIQQVGLEHERVRFDLANGQSLRFCDPRKFGRFRWMETPAVLDDELGVEPLSDSFAPEVLGALLHGRDRMIKAILLDQTVIAGLGNIYVDESLWRAGLHPHRKAASLSHSELSALHGAIRWTLQRGLALGGTSLGQGLAYFQRVNGESGRHQDVLDVFRRTGKPCRRCGAAIARLVVAQRGTHICPVCQRLLDC